MPVWARLQYTAKPLASADGAHALLAFETFQDYADLLFAKKLAAGLTTNIADYTLRTATLLRPHSCLLPGPGGPSKCSLEYNPYVSKFR
jgi:hypothetical protein